jgi:hypothetical protein
VPATAATATGTDASASDKLFELTVKFVGTAGVSILRVHPTDRYTRSITIRYLEYLL